MLASQSVLAEKVLASATGYSSNKKIIHNSFFNQNDELSLESVKLRLIAIDSTYSTQMSKRLFGITDLAKELLVISEGKDSVIRKKLISYLKAPLPEDDIGRILIKPFGLTKSGEVGGVATSLLSKYFYFLLDFKFPIYDSLVRDVLPLLNNKFKILAKTSFGSNSDRSPYFKTLLEFNKLSKINDIDRLDNLCWLFGKVAKGSFSLILDKERYKKLISEVGATELKGKSIDEKITNYLSEKIPKEIFSKELIEFIGFVNNTRIKG